MLLGFELNPHDLCVANAKINRSQLTMCWNVDDNKIAHTDPSVVSDVIEKLESKFGKMTIARGKKHNFLGIMLTFHDNRHLEIDIKENIKITVHDFGDKENLKQTIVPARSTLFNDSENILNW